MGIPFITMDAHNMVNNIVNDTVGERSMSSGYTNIIPLQSDRIFETSSKLSGTDQSETFFSYTAENSGVMKFSSDSKCFTNTGNNEGYFIIKVGNDEKFRFDNITPNRKANFNIPDIHLNAGETIELVFGFTGSHTNSYLDLYSAMAFCS
jgi:hypothetical protein